VRVWAVGLAALAASGRAGAETCDRPLTQDLNCNLVDVADEPAVDLALPACAAAVATFGDRASTGDAWIDYDVLGCALSVLDQDSDTDGFGYGDVVLADEIGNPVLEIRLRCDLCPDTADDQSDTDCDAVGDACDACPDTADDQSDTDQDGRGDVCDVCPVVADDGADADADGVPDACDPCPADPSPTDDRDHDGVGDACDACPDHDVEPGGDLDGDGVPDGCDTCPALVADALDTDGDGVGDACDNCVEVSNVQQTDWNADGVGDACDAALRLAGGTTCSTGPRSPGWAVASALVALVLASLARRTSRGRAASWDLVGSRLG
jgi:hypothetical protein